MSLHKICSIDLVFTKWLVAVILLLPFSLSGQLMPRIGLTLPHVNGDLYSDGTNLSPSLGNSFYAGIKGFVNTSTSDRNGTRLNRDGGIIILDYSQNRFNYQSPTYGDGFIRVSHVNFGLGYNWTFPDLNKYSPIYVSPTIGYNLATRIGYRDSNNSFEIKENKASRPFGHYLILGTEIKVNLKGKTLGGLGIFYNYQINKIHRTDYLILLDGSDLEVYNSSSLRMNYFSLMLRIPFDPEKYRSLL